MTTSYLASGSVCVKKVVARIVFLRPDDIECEDIRISFLYVCNI